MKIVDFDILETLFQSNSGVVYKARWKQKDKIVVLKRKDFSELGKLKDVGHEANLLSKLRHPNIVEYYGSFRDHTGSIFLVLEYAIGGDLAGDIRSRRKENRPFAERAIWDIIHQICSGLVYLHSNNVIHRDVKCMNIFITETGKVRPCFLILLLRAQMNKQVKIG
eukprot:Rmarinus@m.5520